MQQNFSQETRQTTFRLSTIDDQMVTSLYQNHASNLLSTILKLIPQHETAEDILHDTFLKIKNGIHLYNAQKSQLLTWSRAIAKNTAVDYLRLRSSRNIKLNNTIENSEFEINLTHYYSLNIDCIGLKQLFFLLSKEQLAVVDLCYYSGYTHEETAEALNIPLGTIKTRIRSSIKTLRLYLN